MDKLRVGIIVYHESKPTEGGGHSYYETLLTGINEFSFDPGIEIINIVLSGQHAGDLKLKKPTVFFTGKHDYEKKIKKKVKNFTSLVKLSTFLSRKNPLVDFLMTIREETQKRKIEQILRENKIDLIYYLKPDADVLNYPFITTHWDIAHKSIPAFPETSLDGHYKVREDYYQYTLSKAFLILCESVTGAQELRAFYSCYYNKIKVVPLFASNILNVRVNLEEQSAVLKKYDLEKDRFFVYPAQFWSHKNHYHLILAFNNLVKSTQDSKLKLLLPGSDNGNLAYILQVTKSLSLTKQVITPGFVSTNELYTFYKNAISLVMPTFLGPTNMPIIEAAHLKCAVVCSDIPGHREILGGTALYFNPADYNSISVAMQQTMDTNIRGNLVNDAYEQINASPFLINNSLNILNSILIESKPIRKTWGINYSINCPI